MKYFRHLLLIKFLAVLLGLLQINLLGQNEAQQLRLAKSLEKNHEYEAALRIYQNLEKNNFARNEAIEGIEKCLIGLLRFNDLVTFLEKIVNQNQSNQNFQIALAEAYLLNSEKEKALNQWKEVIKRRTNDLRTYRLVASSMLKHRLIDEAIEVYEQALVNLKNQHILHLDLANLYKSMLRTEDATRHYLEYYSLYPRQHNFLQRQILNLTKSDEDVDKVADVLKNYIESHKDNQMLKEILAGLYIKSKQFDNAYEVYASLEESKKDGTYLFKFAKEAQNNNSYKYAINAFSEILEINNSRIYDLAYFELAQTYYEVALHEKDKKPGEALQKATSMYKNLMAKNNIQNFSDISCMQLGDIYLDFYFDLDEAIQHYNQLIQNYPKSKHISMAYIKLGDAWLIKGNLTEAKKIYSRNKTKNQFSITTFKLAELAYYQAHFSEALKLYNKILEKKGAADSLANNALERSIFINSFISDSINLKDYAYAELLMFQQKYSESIKQMSHLYKSNSNLSTRAGGFIGDLLLKLEKFDEANIVFQDLWQQHPDDSHADKFLFRNASIEEFLGNHQKAFELYQTLLNNYDNSLFYERARERARALNEIIKQNTVSG